MTQNTGGWSRAVLRMRHAPLVRVVAIAGALAVGGGLAAAATLWRGKAPEAGGKSFGGELLGKTRFGGRPDGGGLPHGRAGVNDGHGSGYGLVGGSGLPAEAGYRYAPYVYAQSSPPVAGPRGQDHEQAPFVPQQGTVAPLSFANPTGSTSGQTLVLSPLSAGTGSPEASSGDAPSTEPSAEPATSTPSVPTDAVNTPSPTSPVPEPATGALAALGVMMVYLARRSRRV